MTASLNDKITDTRNAARPNSARVSSPRVAAGTTLTCDNLVGWSTASKVHFVTYTIDSNSNPVAGSQLDCYGIVSGNTITSMTIVDGTDSGNAIGDVVEMLPTAAWGQDLSDALLVGHTRTGAHVAGLPLSTPAITTPTITGGTISSPTIVTPTIASFTNANHDHLNAAGGGTLGTNAIGPANLAGATIIQGVQDLSVSPISSGGPADVASSGVTFTTSVASYALVTWGMATQINASIFRTVTLSLNVDGSNIIGVAGQGVYSSNTVNSYSMQRLVTLTAASHTIKLQIATSSAGAVAATQIFWYAIIVAQ